MSEQLLKMYYHPAKKEVIFERYGNGKKIPISNDSVLQMYMNQRGYFVLQDYGNDLFDNIAQAFDGIKTLEVHVSTTKLDYEDFLQMINYYNSKDDCKCKFNVTKFMELPNMEETVKEVFRHANDSIRELERRRRELQLVCPSSELIPFAVEVFTSKRSSSNVKKSIENYTRDLDRFIANIRKKIDGVEDSKVNLCFTGVYSSGKSTLINTLLGYRILPEAMKSTTAKMFVISSPEKGENVEISFRFLDRHIVLRWCDKAKAFEILYRDTGKNKYVDEIQNLINDMQNRHVVQYEQIYKTLEKINGIEEVSSEIYVKFPIKLDSDTVQFTIYDTPGTDSNYECHKGTLKRALEEQKKSILVFVIAPNKLEGEGNRVLLDCLKNVEENCGTSSIDLGRSLFVCNFADTVKRTVRKEFHNEIICYHGNKDNCINLSNKRLFFTAASYGYAAKAVVNGIAGNDESYDVERNELCDERSPKSFCFREDRCATSELATKQLLEQNESKLRSVSGSSAEMLYVASGMYALENEIKKYGEKYASATKAFAIIDCVDKILNSATNQTNSLKERNQASIEKNGEEFRKVKREIEKIISRVKGDMPNFDYGNCEVRKKLGIDSESLANMAKDVKSYIERKIEIIHPYMYVFGESREYDEKKIEEVTSWINGMLENFGKNYCHSRERLLKEYQSEFMQKIRQQISEVRVISESTKRIFIDLREPDIKIDNTVVKLEVEEKYTEKAGVIIDDNVFTDEGFVKFEKNAEDALRKVAEGIAKKCAEDFMISYKQMLDDVEITFNEKMVEFSEDLSAMKEDKEYLQKLAEIISNVAVSLKTSQDELDNVIWKIKEA